MGGLVSFGCLNCGDTEERIGFGHGKQPEPYLYLYRCNKCSTPAVTEWLDDTRD
jgi:hypothetical protein